MSAIKSLLAATDFSDEAGSGLARAARIASEQQAALVLLHVISGPSLDLVRNLFRQSPDVEAKVQAEAQEVLGRLAADIADVHHVSVTPRVRIGPVLKEILAAAGQADLLVIGAHGLNPIRDLILGTTAERLLGKCMQPSLVVKRPPQDAYRRVIVPVDFSRCSAASIAIAMRIAPQAEILVCHAYDAPFEGKLWLAGVSEDQIERYRTETRERAMADMDQLIESVAAEGFRLSPLVERGDANRVILAKEAEREADLIVIGKHGRSAVENFFLGSVTRHILSGSKCDVLVVQ